MAIARVSWPTENGETRRGVLVGFWKNDGYVMTEGTFERIELYRLEFDSWCD